VYPGQLKDGSAPPLRIEGPSPSAK
jgi:hypothetical protein